MCVFVCDCVCVCVCLRVCVHVCVCVYVCVYVWKFSKVSSAINVYGQLCSGLTFETFENFWLWPAACNHRNFAQKSVPS